MPETLLQMLNASPEPNKIKQSAIIVVDAQREYLDGNVPLVGIKPALSEIRQLLQRARAAGSQIIFIRHSAGNGSPVFNPETERFQIIDEVAPEIGEVVIDKHYPNSFAHTSLQDELKKMRINHLILTGFMTHGCISASVRSAAERGFTNTIVADACATRDLPGTKGDTIKADQVHTATLAALQDIFAAVVPNQSALAE